MSDIRDIGDQLVSMRLRYDIAASRAEVAEARVAELTAENEALCYAEASLTARVGELGNALSRCVVEMNHARIFVTSRERIKRPEGEDLYDEIRAEAEQVLAGSPAPVREAERAVVEAAKEYCQVLNTHRNPPGAVAGALVTFRKVVADLAKARETGEREAVVEEMGSEMTLPKIADNDRDEITAEFGGKEIRGWSYKDSDERRAKMQKAHEFAEGWYQASKAMSARLLNTSEPKPLYPMRWK